MNSHSTLPRFFLPMLGACGIALLAGSGLTAAAAATNTLGAPASRALAPAAAKPGSATAPAPIAMNPDIVADGGGVHIGGTMAPFNGSAAINSRSMVALTPVERARNRDGAEPCRFTGSFTLKNVGAGSPASVGLNGFDVYTWVEQPQGPQVGKIGNTGYFIPDLKPGATYPQNFSFDLRPGSYVFWLSIDPYHKLKQATPGNKTYHVQLNASCGITGIQRMQVPAGIRPVNH